MVLISVFLSKKVLVHFNDSALTDSADPPCFHPHFVWSMCSVPVGVLDLRNGCCYLERGLSVSTQLASPTYAVTRTRRF
jgi:hypothetical protein